MLKLRFEKYFYKIYEKAADNTGIVKVFVPWTDPPPLTPPIKLHN